MDPRTILEKSDAEMHSRAEQMPTETHALTQMNQAYLRLKELGFKDIIYCPKDGSKFEAIEAGSSVMHSECSYQGDWPNGSWNAWHENEAWPIHPILYRLKNHKQ